ncbi:hypothetical protein VPNG_02190 [Cytospora leucostoma]|uniref:Carboxylesterase type B domain-containing protein n=1 Tax=Cytospora leucostoma TaxID=1230097 RepID=A0A423XHQ4_9PEZI|nr:hypothetical protein VPNG_02190 [Cytospora leucostoma]
MASETVTLEHPSVGQIHGVKPEKHPQVEQYLGIQYATLANQFARGTPVETYPAPIQATKTGPLPVAEPGNCDVEHELLQHALPHPDYEFSDTECLTLNVTVPSQDVRVKAARPLPVVVFVHGGGFVTGSANWPQWQLTRLVERSVENGSPVIAVGINYRLGPFGFLTSSALRDAGFKANNGLDDQKLGLRWVQKYIGGFGGNPNRITYLGSSMGAASGFFHLQSTEPLFNQFVALGGNPLLLQPIPQEVAEVAYSILTSILGLDGLPPAEQVKALLEIPATQLSAKLAAAPPIPIAAVLDGDVIRSRTTYAGLSNTDTLESVFPGAEWCKTILLGDGQLDGNIMAFTALANRTDNLAASLRSCLKAEFPDKPDNVKAVLDAYGIDESNTDILPVIQFINDISFAHPAKITAQAWAEAGSRLGTKSFLSHFNAPNPWPGAWQGHATHTLDLVFLLGNYNEFLSEGQRAASERFVKDFLALAYGEEPFPPFSAGQDGTARVYYAGKESDKDESLLVNESDKIATGRRGILEDTFAGQPEVLDTLLNVFGLFLQGPR